MDENYRKGYHLRGSLFCVCAPWARSNGWKSRVRVGNDEVHSRTARVSTTKREIINKYRIGKDFGVKFTDKHGNERVRLLWKGSLAKDPHPLGQEADVIHKPKGILKKPSLGSRMKVGRCEWCGKVTPKLVVHQVRTMKELDVTQPWAAFMKKINRKTLVVCESRHAKIHGADC